MKRSMVQVVGVMVLLAALTVGATDYFWMGSEADSLTDVSKYTVNGETASSLPGETDQVVLWSEHPAVVDNDSVSVLAGVGQVLLSNTTSRLTFNVTTNFTLPCTISSFRTVNKVVSRVGTVVKNASSEMTLTSIRDEYLATHHYDYYFARFEINDGTVRLPQPGTIDYEGKTFIFGFLHVEAPGLLYLPQPGWNYVYGLAGSGTLTNDCALTGLDLRLRIQGEGGDFTGTVGYRQPIRFSVINRQSFTVASNELAHLSDISIESSYTQFNRPGYLGLYRFGSTTSPGSLGYAKFRFSGDGGYLEHLGPAETSAAVFNIFGTAAYPTYLDGGINGGLTLTGSISLVSTEKTHGAGHLILTGPCETNDCTLSGKLYDSTYDGICYPLYLEKRGAGTWNLGRCDRTNFSGGIAVREGTLAFETLAERGKGCSLGMATNLYEALYGNDLSTAVPTAYAIRLGDETDLTHEGSLEYRGTTSARCMTRPIAIFGHGRIVNASDYPLVLGGVSAASTADDTLTLGGNGAANQLHDVTNGVGSLAIVKEGPGSWTLVGEQTFAGDVTVKEGALAIGAKFEYFRLNYRLNNTNATNWINYKKHCKVREFGLFDADGNRCNANLEYVTTDIDDLQPGQIGYRQWANVTHDTGSYANCGPDKLCDCDTLTYHYAPGPVSFVESTPSTWTSIEMRLPTTAGAVTSVDLIPNDTNVGSVFMPCSWSVEASIDRSDWVTVFETNNVTYTHTNWFSDGSPFDANRTHTGFPIAGPEAYQTSAPTIGSLRVDSGATLNVYRAVSPVGSLTVSTNGIGAIRGVSLASTGVVDLIADCGRQPFLIPVDLSAIPGGSNLRTGGWSFTCNGGQPIRKGVVTVTEDGFHYSPNGFVLIMR